MVWSLAGGTCNRAGHVVTFAPDLSSGRGVIHGFKSTYLKRQQIDIQSLSRGFCHIAMYPSFFTRFQQRRFVRSGSCL
ncbi:hypothetical protein HanHA300_Chr08g0275451 [Helianthus annuus]|nr:hypothetical protein HanHA300_Chr08g0275451 [Helianthus annuus]